MLLIWKTSLQEHMTLITSGLGLCLGNFNWKAWLFSGRFLYLFPGFFSHQSRGFDLPFRPLFSDLQVLLSNQMLYLLVNAIHHSYSQKVYLLKNKKTNKQKKNNFCFSTWSVWATGEPVLCHELLVPALRGERQLRYRWKLCCPMAHARKMP